MFKWQACFLVEQIIDTFYYRSVSGSYMIKKKMELSENKDMQTFNPAESEYNYKWGNIKHF